MQIRFKHWIAALGIATAASGAQAWTAVTYSSKSGFSYIYYKAATQEEAEREALAGCRRHSAACSLVGNTVPGPVATMVVRGDRGISRGSDADPALALSRAMGECKQQDKNCRLVTAVWDGGASLMAVAIDKEGAWAGTPQPSAEQARENALATCRQHSRMPEQCSIYHLFTGRGWAAIARAGNNASGIGISVRSSKIAAEHASSECDKAALAAGPVLCDQPEIFHNQSGMPEPAIYRELLRQVISDRLTIAASEPPFVPRK